MGHESHAILETFKTFLCAQNDSFFYSAFLNFTQNSVMAQFFLKKMRWRVICQDGQIRYTLGHESHAILETIKTFLCAQNGFFSKVHFCILRKIRSLCSISQKRCDGG